MKPLTIGIIVCLIISISLAVYFLTRPKTTKTKEQTLLDDAPRAFALSLAEQFLNETFATDIVFDSVDKINKNIMKFLDYMYPKMNVDKINELLPTYGITDKKMTDIFSDNQNTIDIFSDYGVYYIPLMFKDIDNKIVIDNIKLYAIVSSVLLNLLFEGIIKSPYYENTHNIEYLKFNLNSDYKTNNIISYYIRTNINKGIPLNQATTRENILDNECLTTLLCKKDINIQTEYIDKYKNLATINIVNCEKLFNLVIIKSLLKINGSTDFKNIEKDIEDLYKILIGAGFDENEYPNPL
jgi:hypothetical protein